MSSTTNIPNAETLALHMPNDDFRQPGLTVEQRRQRLLKPESGEKRLSTALAQLKPWPGGDSEEEFAKTLEEFKEIFG